jgi:hypothetical protein
MQTCSLNQMAIHELTSLGKIFPTFHEFTVKLPETPCTEDLTTRSSEYKLLIKSNKMPHNYNDTSTVLQGDLFVRIEREDGDKKILGDHLILR